METLEELYDFYIENCVDEEKGEIPLNFKEWKDNHSEEEMAEPKLNKMKVKITPANKMKMIKKLKSKKHKKIYIENSLFMELVDEFATQITEMNFGAETWEWVEPDETSFERDLKERTQVFSSEAQDYYNEMYSEYETLLNTLGNMYPKH